MSGKKDAGERHTRQVAVNVPRELLIKTNGGTKKEGRKRGVPVRPTRRRK